MVEDTVDVTSCTETKFLSVLPILKYFLKIFDSSVGLMNPATYPIFIVPFATYALKVQSVE